jgi:hypothetical protein
MCRCRVLSDLAGIHRHPERFFGRFAGQVVQARRALRRTSRR